MFDLFGSGLPLAARFFIAFLVVLALIGLTAWVVRRFGSARLGGAGARGRQPRLAVIDAASVDGRRRLVLIRRDNIEHLLMIGGPTDVVIEPNIVRAAAARESTREPALRPAPGAETAWPLQPENEPPPVAPPRPYRAPSEETQAPRAPASDEPWLPQQTGAHPRPADSLSGLAAELSSKLTPPEAAAPPVESGAMPVEPPLSEPAPTVDQNLSEMAKQLEAALRRAPLSEGRPPVTAPLATQSHAPISEPEPARGTKPPEPRMSESRAPEPKIEPRAEAKPISRPAPSTEPKIEPKAEPKFEARFGARTEPRTEPKLEPKFEPKAEQKPAPEAKPEPSLAPDKTLYDNLEEEMASLLGRPSGKS